MLTEPNLRLMLMALSALCMVWGIARGIGRLALFAVAVAAGGLAGWAFFRYAPGPLISWLGGFHPDATAWGSVVAGTITAIFVRRFLGALFTGGASVLTGTGPRMKHGVLSLLPTLLLVWGVAMAARWGGAVARMRWVEAAAAQPNLIDHPPFLVRLRDAVSTGALGGMLDRVDPLNSAEASTLGSLLTLRRNEDAWAALKKNPELTAALKPVLQRLLNDKDVIHSLSFSHYSELMTLPEVAGALANPALRDALRNLPVDQILSAALHGESQAYHPVGGPTAPVGNPAAPPRARVVH